MMFDETMMLRALGVFALRTVALLAVAGAIFFAGFICGLGCRP